MKSGVGSRKYGSFDDSRLPTSDSRLPTSDSRLPTSDSRLPTSKTRLSLSGFLPPDSRQKSSKENNQRTDHDGEIGVERTCKIDQWLFGKYHG
jgi:hypothetical protein